MNMNFKEMKEKLFERWKRLHYTEDTEDRALRGIFKQQTSQLHIVNNHSKPDIPLADTGSIG